MYDFTNMSLPVSGETSFIVTTTVAMGIISMETRLGFDYALLAFGPAISFFGIGGNIVNIIIFFREGLNNTINISFFTLAIADLCSLVSLITGCVCLFPPLVNSGLPLDFQKIAYLLSGWPHLCFGNISSWITVYITAERCLCIAMPLKVKEIITPRVTSFIICAIYLLNILPASPDFMYTFLDWKFSTKQNRTILSLAYRKEFNFLEGIGVFSASMLGSVSFPTVIIFTVILVVKLQQQTLWRQKSSQDSQKAQASSKREMRTMKTVVLIAIIFIICYIPGVAVTTAMFIVPGFGMNGRYENIYLVFSYVIFIMHVINSSVNIFLYYNLSSKFKESFHQLFEHCICVPRDIDDTD